MAPQNSLFKHYHKCIIINPSFAQYSRVQISVRPSNQRVNLSIRGYKRRKEGRRSHLRLNNYYADPSTAVICRVTHPPTFCLDRCIILNTFRKRSSSTECCRTSLIKIAKTEWRMCHFHYKVTWVLVFVIKITNISHKCIYPFQTLYLNKVWKTSETLKIHTRFWRNGYLPSLNDERNFIVETVKIITDFSTKWPTYVIWQSR